MMEMTIRRPNWQNLVCIYSQPFYLGFFLIPLSLLYLLFKLTFPLFHQLLQSLIIKWNVLSSSFGFFIIIFFSLTFVLFSYSTWSRTRHIMMKKDAKLIKMFMLLSTQKNEYFFFSKFKRKKKIQYFSTF